MHARLTAQGIVVRHARAFILAVGYRVGRSRVSNAESQRHSGMSILETP